MLGNGLLIGTASWGRIVGPLAAAAAVWAAAFVLVVVPARRVVPICVVARMMQMPPTLKTKSSEVRIVYHGDFNVAADSGATAAD